MSAHRADIMAKNSGTKISRFHGEFRWLSNFFLTPVVDSNGRVHPSVEHAYQPAKATTVAERESIMSASTAKKAKRRGSKLNPPPDWKDRKIDVMRSLLRIKFAPGTPLAERLIETGNRVLEEGKDWGDTFWGVCAGEGENHLGRMLLDLRAELKRGHSNPDRIDT